MFFLGVIFLVLIGVGVAIGLVASLIAGILLSLGVLSSSIFIGIRSGRPSAGIRAFLLQCGVLAGIPAGVICAWVVQSLSEAYGSHWQVLLYGALGGAISGVVIAFLFDFILRRLHAWASDKFSTTDTLIKR